MLSLTQDDLCLCLSDLPAVPLKGLAWLDSATPLDSECLREALLELMDYTRRCEQVGQRLQQLAPVPLKVPTVEWIR
jgi:hypothetical protein